ncbi:MAG: AAA family ATPase [Kiritimatiellae bacterium]|nr:AAA family ATPase [Kiritimatiellia bacterium]
MFVGRQYYLERLAALWKKASASMVVVSGRRRIGKSTLVEMFAERSKCRFIEIAGLAPDKDMTNERQIANFCERLAQITGTPKVQADCWPKAFDALYMALPKNGRIVVFLDEISWMGGYDTAFAAYLKNAWDIQLSRKDRLILVVAGSVSSWIQANILQAKAFVGRISLDVSLPELPLADCRTFWARKTGQVPPRDILDVLSVTGGIPKYLQEMDPSLSADENIRRLCFMPEGYLFKDFGNIFGDIFGAAAAKRRILQVLASGTATLSDIADRLGMAPNGHIGEDLRDLAAAGFVAFSLGKNPRTGTDAREVLYRLSDNYSRFYLKFIEPKREAIRNGLFRFTALDRLPGWDSIMGLQFENLVLNNLKTLCRLIGLEGRLVTSAAPYRRCKHATSPGVQIDLLIQTPKSAYIVEIKRRMRISGQIEEELQSKVQRLATPTGVSVRTVLVYEGTLAPEVEENGYIDHLVPIERFFETSGEGD